MEEYGLWRCFAPHYIDGLKHNLFEPVLQCGNSKAFIKELFGWMTPCKALSTYSIAIFLFLLGVGRGTMRQDPSLFLRNAPRVEGKLEQSGI